MVTIRGDAGNGPAYRPSGSRRGNPIYPTWTEGGARSRAGVLVYEPRGTVEYRLRNMVSDGKDETIIANR